MKHASSTASTSAQFPILCYPLCVCVQGFPDWRVLEDVGIVQQLNRLSPPAIVPRTVVTSGRKYQALGFWRTVASHQAIMLGWAAGLRHQQLLQLYDACSNARKG